MNSLVSAIVLVFALVGCTAVEVKEDDASASGAYSYHNFSGPVSGQIREVYVKDKLDYVAKPDYSYSYGVKDPSTGNDQQHRQTRLGDAVQGEYKVLQADGSMRVVRYTADAKNGFRATVEYH
ncbi:PREDICTED: cuticle protein 19-like [Nicrophorus vespilloides]|uniref:Cuticle protein 19-like n=1 Tax=Nicrophorus vespilloides TaxID=110193 RepID=A0ABM1MXV5_NICVS|nr:PREDICTED: cuticle protein 19-like [Nicrophorus vespilloides]